MSKFFEGIATALATSMLEDGSLDIENYRKLLRFQFENGVNALVVAGTTGEGSTLSMDEKIELLKVSIEERGSRNCPLIIGTGSNNTKATIENTLIAKENGADAALLVTPYYNKTSQRGLIAHYSAVANSVDIPIILYNVPGRTGMTIEPETVGKLASIPNIVGLKDATGNMQYMESVRKEVSNYPEFALYSGDDGTFFDFLAHGGDGVISVLTNCLPEAFIREYRLFNEGKLSEARELQNSLNPFIKSLFSDISPTPVKAVLKNMGCGEEFVRLPLVPTTDEIRSNVISLYNKTVTL